MSVAVDRQIAKAKRPRSKYHAKACIIDGVRFASHREGTRYLELSLAQKIGEIHGMELQPVFPIVVNGLKICDYRGDFRYIVTATGEVITEDVKGLRLPVYALKAKLVRAVHRVVITEV